MKNLIVNIKCKYHFLLSDNYFVLIDISVKLFFPQVFILLKQSLEKEEEEEEENSIDFMIVYKSYLTYFTSHKSRGKKTSI